MRAAESDSDQWGALVLDATQVRVPADLGGLRTFFGGRVRQLLPSGRVLVLGRTPSGQDASTDATRQALDGIVRSLAKELRVARRPTCCSVEDDASLESALRFFLSGKSAYVDGQPVLLGPGRHRRPRTGTPRWPARRRW